jgi:phage FluMu gp28-like protein
MTDTYPCDVSYGRGTLTRPAYVPANFAGKCRVFPQPTQTGGEPTFLSYQRGWASDEHIMMLAEKSRQIGWTWTSAHGIARRHALRDYTLDTWGTSRDDLQAQLAVSDCKTFAGVLHAGAQDMGQVVLDNKGASAHALKFANGTIYYSLSSSPDAQAGKRGNRVGDEFALNKDNHSLYAIMEPGVTWGGFIWLFSTHRGSANYFNQLIQEARHKGNPKGWHVYRVTLQDALDCGFLYKLQRKLPESDRRQQMDEAAYFDFVRAKAADAETFAQEYMCVPSDDASAFISYALLDGCKYAPGVSWETDLTVQAGPRYLGVDIGRTNDLTCFWMIEVVGGIALTRRLVRMQNAPFAEQEKVFNELMETPGMQRACIDQTGIGRQFAERAATRHPGRSEGVTFSGPVKESLAYPLKAAMEDKTFRHPDDEKVVAAFRSIRKETTSAGNVRFAGDRTTNGHADEFWAAALALHAAGSNAGATFPPRAARNTRSMIRSARRAALRHRKEIAA